MKKILFAAFAVSLLTVGCQKTEIIHQVASTDGSLMSFSTEMSKLTKSTPVATPLAEADGMYNLRAQEFRIWAYCDYDDTNTTEIVEKDAIYDGMANLNIGYDKSADYDDAEENDKGTWAPIKEYYWPSAGKALRFFAVSGVDLGEDLSVQNKVNISIERTPGTDNVETIKSTLTINGYTVDNSNPNTDLMVAEVVTHDKSVPDKRVTFNFHHALSKVQFKFKTGGGDAVVKVKNLTVNGIKTIGDLSVVNDEISWSGQATNEDNTKNSFTALSPEGVLLTGTETTLATWLVIPQKIVTRGDDDKVIGGYKVQVVYEIGEGESRREFNAVFPLYVAENERLVKWDKNQYTKYLVTITPNKITFNAEAEEWTPYDSDNDGTSDDIDLQN
jgi:hypothetical protein